MAIGPSIETRGHVTGFREEIARAREAGDDAFFTWFDESRDADAAFVRGAWDFGFHVAAVAAPYLSAPESRTALEIGCGGGRLLAAASRHFRDVIGVDIHDQLEVVADALRRRGVSNARLLRGDGASLPVPDASSDLVYSFIVLQHVERLEVLSAYFRETTRVLRPDGVAVLYVGRRARFSIGRAPRSRYWLDRLLDAARGGYDELPAHVNATNLRVSLRCARRLAREAGLRVRDVVVSRKRVPDGVRRFGGQYGLVLTRAEP